MSNSLRDELLKAGLVSKTQRQGSRPRKKPKGQRRPQGQRDEELRALDAHKKARDRALNEERNRQRQAREQADWARQLVQAHQVDKRPAAADEKPFHFQVDGKIHHLYVDARQREELAAERLGIFWFDGQYHLLPAEQARRLHQRLGRRVWLASLATAAAADEDPAYAQYKVPDDLMW